MARHKVAKKKNVSEMNTRELAEATREFDEEFAYEKGRPLNDRQKELHAKARQRGRPRVGMGARKIQVSIERRLLDRSDAFARKHRMSRSEMIARGLKAVLAAGGADEEAR
jgi:hypothetical protein